MRFGRPLRPGIVDKIRLFSHKAPIAVGEKPFSAQKALPEASPVLVLIRDIRHWPQSEKSAIALLERVMRRRRARTT